MTARVRRSVVLLSGGMDSATCLALASRRGRVLALTLLYGQRHAREVASAHALARHFGVEEHLVLRLPLERVADSALTRRGARLPTGRAHRGRIPSTYVPARNTIFLGVALALAESRAAGTVYFGANAVDYSGYPDCRPAFLRAFERAARLGTRVGSEARRPVRFQAPLLALSKGEIVGLGERLGVPWALTWSCYRGGQRPCGRCDSCRLRAKGFRAAGVSDPGVARGRRPAPRR